MDNIGDGARASYSVTIQTSPHSVPAPPSWLGEVTADSHRLLRIWAGFRPLWSACALPGAGSAITSLFDFVVVLLGYAISGERTLETFYEGLHPYASPFMALFGRERLPHRSTLSSLSRRSEPGGS